MKNNLFLSGILLVCLILSISCKNNNSGLPSSTGKTAEVLFVIDRFHWDGTAGNNIKQIFTAEYQVLNQPEPLFNLAHIEPGDFSKIFQSHRNIIIVEIKDSISKDMMEIRKDVWAQPQLVIKMVSQTPGGFVEMLEKHSKQIIALLYETERKRMQKSFSNEQDMSLTNALQQGFGFSMTLPKGYFMAKKSGDFCWIRRETEETSMGLLVYTYPYTDTISFNSTYILNLRDSLTRIHIPGPRDGSFMQVSHKVVLPVSKKTTFNNRFAVETRGLWDMKGDFMGGPFINYTFTDSTQQKIITLDGFVYAPRFDKRNYIIQLESIIFSYKEP
ncbi:MAG: hypothetical protein BWY70_00741 [Bacteroidetes bacterium ADurb.Bin408]|nr:MAG: hypothetical protein BWY70_00741 [Bacteroidetes bacterium ADurb.Bin408]